MPIWTYTYMDIYPWTYTHGTIGISRIGVRGLSAPGPAKPLALNGTPPRQDRASISPQRDMKSPPVSRVRACCV